MNIKKYLVIILFCFLQALIGVYGQSSNLLKNDSTRQDKTKIVHRKNIKDTTSYNPVGDTAVKNRKPKKSTNEDKPMYLVPDKKKKNSNNNNSNLIP